LKRVAALTIEKRLLNDRGRPNFNVKYYILNAKGEFAGVTLYASRYAACTDSGPQTLEAEALFAGTPQG
jgi:N4-(beta-N-acetylglucosaminyl)-L-asparaginase